MSALKGIDRCESPMELRLAEAFCRLSKWEVREPGDDEHEVGRWPGWAMVLLAQVPMDKYRPDFIITTTRDTGTPGSWVVIVEVDGHDFHERTKEQARRDRSRDRFFVEHDVRVLRYTGSEIYRDATGCAVQAWKVAAAIQQKLFNSDLEAHLLSKFAHTGAATGRTIGDTSSSPSSARNHEDGGRA